MLSLTDLNFWEIWGKPGKSHNFFVSESHKIKIKLVKFFSTYNVTRDMENAIGKFLYFSLRIEVCQLNQN